MTLFRRGNAGWSSSTATWAATAVAVLTMGNVWGQFPDNYKFGDAATGGDFTIAAWFNASESQTTDAALISNKDWGSGGNPGFVLTVDSDETWKLNANGVGGSRADTDWTSFSLNSWVFVVATFDRDGDFTAYTNGGTLTGGSVSARAASTGLIDTFASPLFYDFNVGQDGTGNYAGGQGFRGSIDDVAIWRRALDPTEIASIYTNGTGSSNSLGNLLGTSLNGGLNLIDDALVGYYGFDGGLTDARGTSNGVAKATGDVLGTVSFGGGLFSQALVLDGSNYVTIGENDPLPGIAVANFTGQSTSNNLASNVDNWASGEQPSAWAGAITTVNVINGTTATFTGAAQTGPALFESSLGSREVGSLIVGASGVETFIEFAGNAELIGSGSSNSTIGPANANVTMNMSGTSRFEHRGAGEEQSEIRIGQAGSTVNLTLSDSAELSTGPSIPDANYAIGVRRPQAADPVPRSGDDLFFGDGNDAGRSTVNVTLNDDTYVYVADVFYPGDSNNTLVNVVQNDNSRVLVGWDNRLLDDGHDNTVGVNWTMNGNSQFKVARDHGLGETGGTGFANVTVNDNAEFYAGDRIVLGADGGNVNVTVNGGLMKVGGDSPTDRLLVDSTGERNPGEEDVARDWILHMGGNATATLDVLGGAVEIGRSAYIGRGGGTASVLVDGGRFDVKGVGPIGEGLGNAPGGGVPGAVNWATSGGDLILADDANESGAFHYRSGEVHVARDLVVGFDNDFNGLGGDGVLSIGSGGAGGDAFSVGRDLSFAGDFFAASGGSALFEVVFDGSHVVPMDVAGDVFIYNSGSSVSEFTVSVDGLAPAVGTYEIVRYAGSLMGTDRFTELPAAGLTYSLTYDTANARILLNVLTSTAVDADFNNDGQLDCADVDGLVGEIAAGTNNLAFDLTGDGSVNGDDLQQWLGDAGNANIGAPYLAGDADLSGAVDVSDFNIWNGNKFTPAAAWCQGDFNADGSVDVSDFNVWNGNKFQTSSLAAVPEPSSLLGLAVTAIGLLSLSRRRS